MLFTLFTCESQKQQTVRDVSWLMLILWSGRPFLFHIPHPGCFPVYFKIRLRRDYSLGALEDSLLTIFVFLPAKQHSNGLGRKLIILVFLCGSKWWLRDCEFLIKFSAQQRSMKRCRPCLRLNWAWADACKPRRMHLHGTKRNSWYRTHCTETLADLQYGGACCCCKPRIS